MEGWFEIWFADRQSMIETMIRNLVSDIEAGYNPAGACIMRQNAEIAAFKARFDSDIEHLKEMTEKQAEHWCFLDLKKRGAIA